MESLAATKEVWEMASEATLSDPDRLISKAVYLTWYKAVSRRGDHAWMVDGITGTHSVEVSPDGKVVCDCKGYEVRGVCSHAVAVVMVIEEWRLAKIEAPGRPRNTLPLKAARRRH